MWKPTGRPLACALSSGASGSALASASTASWKKLRWRTDGLHRQEHAVERERQHRDGDGLRRRQRRPRRHDGEVRQDQREDRERDHDRQEGAGARQVVALLVMPQAAEQQAQPDRAVEHEHDDGEHGVAGDRRARRAGRDRGDDERHLDDGNRHREDQRAVGFAEPFREMLGMAHHAERAPQDGGEQPAEQHERQRGALRRRGEPTVAKQQEQGGGQPDRRHLGFAAEQVQHGFVCPRATAVYHRNKASLTIRGVNRA